MIAMVSVVVVSIVAVMRMRVSAVAVVRLVVGLVDVVAGSVPVAVTSQFGFHAAALLQKITY